MARKKAKKTKTSKADKAILDTAPNPNPDAPSNKANLEQNEKIREDAAQQPPNQNP